MHENTAVSINERAAEEYFRRGIDAEKEGNHEKAVEFYERALNENPDHETSAFHLAVLYDRRAEDAKAIELYERICTSPPVHINALMNLAILYEDNNHYDEAHRCLDAMLRTHPESRARPALHEGRRIRPLDVLRRRFRSSRRMRNAVHGNPDQRFRAFRPQPKLPEEDEHPLARRSASTTEPELLSYKNFGETSLNEIKALLASKGLRLGQNAEGGRRCGRCRRSSSRGQPAATCQPKFWPRASPTWNSHVRSRKALQRLNINTLGELAARTEDELLGCKNFGQTSLNEIKQQLTGFGMGLRKLED